MNTEPGYILKGRTISDLERIFKELAEPRFRARQTFRRINKHMATSMEEFSEFPKTLRESLAENDPLPSIKIKETRLSSDGTEKVIFELPPLTGRGKAEQVEAVWIVNGDRRTICISSQVGCTLNCNFCATGTLPFRGNLPTWTIVEQVYALMRHRGERPSNIVFMGMGEPFHNYENVIRAARILHHPDGMHLGAAHITISTAGVIPSIQRFVQDKEPFNLAISLNHPDKIDRSNIMDVNRKYPLDKLIIAIRSFTKALNRRVTFEYVMIPGVNMSEKHQQQLIKLAHSTRSKVNLIPLNTNLAGMRRPSSNEVHEFQDGLLEAGLSVFNRGSPGFDIDGACGMLALKSNP